VARKLSKKVPSAGFRVPSALVIATLIVVTLIVFAQVRTHQFLNYDDGQFIYENPHVSGGLTVASIGWAITSPSIGWYPMTWMSHMLDVDLWKMNAGMHLMTNLALHIISACLLFVALRRMTGDMWPSAFAAALFAIHPAHVESVAWASERKDTLSTLFAMLALFFYAVAPEKRPRLFVAMALSIMAKQMYITLPFVLMLLDFWPLRRGLKVRDKIPLFALTVFGAVMAVIGQRNLNAMQSTEALPLASRLSNAAVAYVRYIGKFFAPVDLAVVYPLQPVPATLAAGAALFIVAISVAAFLLRDRLPFLFTGWFWFVGTLVPVIGIVQIGIQAIADRYTYFPFIGLSIAALWAIPRRALAPIGAAAVIVLMVVAYRQVGYWRDSETLFERTLAITPPNPLAEYSLGQTLEMSQPARAANHLQRAIELVKGSRSTPPSWTAQAHVGLGTALMMQARPLASPSQRNGLIEQAVAEFQEALALDPNAPHARNNIALAQQWLSASGPLSP
jgi:tetratricopeptide (TPR) repeat protein